MLIGGNKNQGAESVSTSDGAAPRGTPGRARGQPNRDKIELRALLQEKVLEFTEMRRQQDLAGLPPDMTHEQAVEAGLVQPIVDEYDPVVALALVAVDRTTPLKIQVQCNTEVAQYVRPKLKSVEITADPEALETLEERRVLTERLVGLLETAASATKPERPRHDPPPSPDAPPPPGKN